MTKISLDSIIDQVDDIGVLPSVVTKIMKLSKDPNSTIHDMEAVVLTDQALTSKLLRLANSAYYGYARRISTISQATILLGFDTISSLALASNTSSMMTGSFKGYSLDHNELWIQSQTCAIISRHIAQKTRMYDAEEAYIAGLLRDIGKTILNQYMIDNYEKVLNEILNKSLSFSQAEKKIFGFNHSEVGARLAEKWNFPAQLVDAIEFHHEPELSQFEDKTLVSIVHLADAMTMMMGVGIGLDGLTYQLSDMALDSLNMNTELFREIMSEATDLIRDQNSFILDILE